MVHGKTEIFLLVTWNQKIKRKHRSLANDFSEVFTEKNLDNISESKAFSSFLFEFRNPFDWIGNFCCHYYAR